MNVLKKIKKIVAIGIGAGMVVSTVAAADLGDFPAPYVNDNGVFSGKIVIGENAATADVIGAIDIATALQAAAGTPVNVAGGVSVAGGELEDVAIGTALSVEFGSELDDVDLPGSLKEFTLKIDNDEVDEDYDVHEVIKLSGSSFGPQTGLTFDDVSNITESDLEDFGDKVFVPINKGDLKYCIDFDETLDTDGYFTNATDDDPIYLDFLGRRLEIVDATATSMKIKVGQTYLLDAGDSVVVDGKTITLVRTNTDSAFVDVDGVGEVIDEGKDEEVNGINVRVDHVYNDDGTEFDSAELIVGEETQETYDDGDAFIGEDDTDYVWEWELANLDQSEPTICASWALDIDTPDGEPDSGIDHPIYEGESYTLPFDYAEVKFDSLTVTDSQEYVIDTDSRSLYNTTSVERYSGNKNVIEITASGLSDQGFLVNGTKSEAVYLYDNGAGIEVFRRDRDGSKALYTHTVTQGGELFKIDYKKSTVPVTLGDWNTTNNNGNMTFTFDSDDVLNVEIDSDGGAGFTYLGDDVEDNGNSETNDLVWTGPNQAKDLKNIESDLRTLTGVVIEDPKSGIESDQYVLHVPAAITDYKANIIVSGKGTTTTKTAGSTAVKVNPIAVGMAVSDADAMGMLGRENLLVVGGPCANSVAASLLDSGADCAEGFEEGFGRIQWFDSQKALLVAGYSAADTTKAARVLAEYADNADDFAGKTEVRVITSTGSITGVE